jgi:alpha-beta hydrolase superfamily lysophospholipase
MSSTLDQFHFVYLHGFASSPDSAKARFFRDRFREVGIQLHIPDLNRPTFTKMTLASHLLTISETAQELSAKPLVIWGSSLGGLAALLFANDNTTLAALILLAPALQLTDRWRSLLGEDQLHEWAKLGQKYFYHYAYQQEVPLSYKFFEEAVGRETSQFNLKLPTLIFHGVNDETVPISLSERLAQAHKDSVTLVKLQDSHALIKTTPLIWQRAVSFITNLPKQ